ncbi:MAG: NAD+ synthase [Candidatus Omnitrophica bacterium]|nr:NAD+ synthase [Candidatus Omnitrophota bacterium]
MTSLRIALAQLNVTVGDLDGNRRLVEEAIRRAQAWLVDLVVAPELAISGYPPEDLLLKPQFVQANLDAMSWLTPMARRVVALVGYVDRARDGKLYNAAAVLSGGAQVATYRKQCLPNYGVFDEKRYFASGIGPLVIEAGGVRVGVTICEDLWEEQPIRALAAAGARLVVNLSASPYHAGKLKERERLFALRARRNRVAIAYCNLIGGQDELVFDGASLVLDARGRLVSQGAQFREDFLVVDVLPAHLRPQAGDGASRGARGRVVVVPSVGGERPRLPAQRLRAYPPVEEIYEALTLGVRDYARKNGFSTVVLGLSGGIDSALTACLAADAVGSSRVVGIVMPSRFSSRATQADATAIATALGIERREISIEPMFQAYLQTLAPHFGQRQADVTEQNLQARIRGNLLMALSNKFGWLVLTTGNKSELATGYCTLYGDMAGGFAVIKDVPKTLVYQLARFRNQRGPGSLPAPARFASQSEATGAQAGPIPAGVFTRAPTAELAPHQTDQDTLPPYDLLDRIVKAYVEEDRSLREILEINRAAPETVARVLRMVDRSEYKRRQGPPGIKITPKAFGKDRRMPITNRYHQGE